MRGSAGGRGGGGRDVVLAAVAALVVLSLGVAGAQRSERLHQARHALEDERVLAELTTSIALDLERAMVAVAEAARNVTAPTHLDPTRAVVPGADDVLFVAARSGAPEPSTSDPVDVEDRAIAALLDRARDSGDVLLGAPVDVAGSARTPVVAAAYVRDPMVGRPVATVDRRTRVAGWVVATIDVGALAQAHLPEGAGASVRDGSTVASTSPAPDGSFPTQVVDVNGRHFEISAGLFDEPGWSWPTVALLVGGVLVALVAAAAVVGVSARLRSLRHAERQRAEQVRLIGQVAPLVQQSLELSEILPAVAVQLSDHFGLAGISVATATGGAAHVEIFSVGDTPDTSVAPVLRPPERLAAGATLALALQRGGRSVALLHLVAGRDLDEADLHSLRALTELVTASVVNASLYSSQQAALHQLRELDALKTVFLGTASHELRTPATAITGFASLLATSWDRFDEEQRRDFVDRIAANGRSLSAVVQDLLDFSLLDRGTVSVAIEPVDLGGAVEAVVGRLSPMFTDHRIAFSAEPTPLVAADSNGLERIVTNLLTNAVKFSPPDTTVSVSVGPAGDGYGAQVVVSDQGPGIPPEERHQVFMRFYRGSSDSVVQTRGVGIGLSVVSELVARLRGDVLLDEAPGGGARFTVRLPSSSSLLLAKEAEHAPTT